MRGTGEDRSSERAGQVGSGGSEGNADGWLESGSSLRMWEAIQLSTGEKPLFKLKLGSLLIRDDSTNLRAWTSVEGNTMRAADQSIWCPVSH